jgi:hypothetical protein
MLCDQTKVAAQLNGLAWFEGESGFCRGTEWNSVLYEKRRRVKPVLARFSLDLKSFPLKAVFVFFHSGQ